MGHSLTQHGGHGAPDHAPARDHDIVERRGGGGGAERGAGPGPQPRSERGQQRPPAQRRHRRGTDGGRKWRHETMTTAVRAAGLASDWLSGAKWAGPSAASRADWCRPGAGRAEAVARRGEGARSRRSRAGNRGRNPKTGTSRFISFLPGDATSPQAVTRRLQRFPPPGKERLLGMGGRRSPLESGVPCQAELWGDLGVLEEDEELEGFRREAEVLREKLREALR